MLFRSIPSQDKAKIKAHFVMHRETDFSQHGTWFENFWLSWSLPNIFSIKIQIRVAIANLNESYCCNIIHYLGIEPVGWHQTYHKRIKYLNRRYDILCGKISQALLPILVVYMNKALHLWHLWNDKEQITIYFESLLWGGKTIKI